MTEKIIYIPDTYSALLSGANGVADPIRYTIGPRGRNVALERPNKSPLITNDSVEIVTAYDMPENNKANSSFQLFRQLALDVKDQVGDGAATAIVIAQELIRGCLENIVAGADPNALRKGLFLAAEMASRAICDMAREIDDTMSITQIAIAASNDSEIGRLAAELVTSAREGTVIAVEESKGLDTYTEYTEGTRLERGFLSPRMAGDTSRMETVLVDALILLTDYAIEEPTDLLPAMEIANQESRPLFVIADDISGGALTLLLANFLRGKLRSVGIRAPEFSNRRKDSLRDIALLTGGTVISSDFDMRLVDIKRSHFGSAKKIIVAANSTLMIGSKGDPVEIEKRRQELTTAYQAEQYGFDRKKIRNRIDKLSGGIALLKVGAASEIEMSD
jgi:chaperonin GroEL